MNDLARMIDRMGRADREPNPAKALRILMGWTCGRCRQEFTPTPADQLTLGVKLTVGLPIIGPCCANLPAGQTPKEEAT